jgi:GDPmannose 4,6-dehydratase
MPCAFITGITGQDGSYLTELLLAKGYEVHGLVRRPEALVSSPIGSLIEDDRILNKQLFLHNGAFEEATRLRQIIHQAKPNEFYHLAAQSSPRLSLEMPETALESIGMGTVRILEILRDMSSPPKFLYASSSEVFGTPSYAPQDELCPMHAATPYGAAKAMAQQMTTIYRLAHRLPTCSAILYNHESPRRGPSFVTMKVARAVARIRKGLQSELKLGSLAGRRDWGWAPDYVEGMWKMLQNKALDDFILATGRLSSVEELVACAFDHVGLHWRDYVRYDASLVTVIEPIASYGNPAKAQRLLGWQCSMTLADIMGRLVDAESEKTR